MPQPKRFDSNAQRQAAYRARQKHALSALHLLPPLPTVPGIPGTLRWRWAVHLAHELVATVHTEMDDYYNGRSEDWQDGDRGEEFNDRKEAIEEAADKLAELADNP
uniref:Uncharacterized protein n=1 Tax=uncultured bacterium RM44 TaxID=672208 RepID=D3W8N0_9BACT|nr:hypothetical protein [uncultured bacterium RM44]